jgi:hypothetical protein
MNNDEMRRRARLRIMKHAGKAETAKDNHDWVALVDARTSADDARIALRVLMES